MNKSAICLFAVFLLGGCDESVEETETLNDKPTAADVRMPAETPSVRSTEAESVAAEATPPSDAESLLTATLEIAKADNKRVMVHLGATW